jgi:hypothetical protein
MHTHIHTYHWASHKLQPAAPGLFTHALPAPLLFAAWSRLYGSCSIDSSASVCGLRKSERGMLPLLRPAAASYAGAVGAKLCGMLLLPRCLKSCSTNATSSGLGPEQQHKQADNGRIQGRIREETRWGCSGKPWCKECMPGRICRAPAQVKKPAAVVIALSIFEQLHPT